MGNVVKFHSFAYDSITTLGYEGWAATSNMTPTISSGGGPYGENALQLVASNNGQAYSLALLNTTTTISMGAFFKINRIPTSSDYLCGFGLSNNTSLYVRGAPAGTGQIQLVTSYGNNLSAPSTTFVQANAWFHLQLDAYYNGSGANSTYTAKINGVTDMAYSPSAFTMGPSATTFNTVNFGSMNGGSPTFLMANLWIAEGGFKGQCLARASKPTANGTTIGLTPYPAGAGTNWDRVDESSFDSADYVTADTTALPLIDTYVTENMSDTPSDNGMQAFGVKIVGKKVGSATALARGVARYSGTDYANTETTALNLGASSSGRQFIWNTKPNDAGTQLSTLSGADAKTLFDSLEVGVKLATS